MFQEKMIWTTKSTTLDAGQTTSGAETHSMNLLQGESHDLIVCGFGTEWSIGRGEAFKGFTESERFVRSLVLFGHYFSIH